MKTLTQLMMLLCMPVSLAFAAVDVEIRKTTSNELPAPGEPVEFTIAATNVGDEIAPDVIIIDLLPPDLELPEGTGAFPGVGTYDPLSGEWLVGNLDVGQTAVLVVPAIVASGSQAECIVNVASLGTVDVDTDNNDAAVALVRRSADARCVDLSVSFGISSGPQIGYCDQFGRYEGDVQVSNIGFDAAHDVKVEMDWFPAPSQNVMFSDPDCSNSRGTTCMIDEISPGQTIVIDVTSDDYQSYESESQTVTISVSTSDTDYELSNNSPSAAGETNAFSLCMDFDLDLPGFFTGPTCFVATAAYGTPLDARLDVLRNFRDKQLLTNRLGRALVSFYYEHSPPIAAFIAERNWLRAVVRIILQPVVFAIEYPFAAALLIVLTGVGIARRLGKGRRRPAEVSLVIQA